MLDIKNLQARVGDETDGKEILRGIDLTIDDGKDVFDFEREPDAAATEEVERPEPDAGDPELQARVLEALKTVQDPEIPVNLVDLGLIYELIVRRDGTVYVEMTLTTPACPVAGALPSQVQQAVAAVAGVNDVRVKLVWTPPWSQDRMSEEARLELGLM
jgi:FeS assembly SUF system protein